MRWALAAAAAPARPLGMHSPSSSSSLITSKMSQITLPAAERQVLCEYLTLV